mmetsp:Transcript_4835/g.14650  ORF Transcript_4835/g.14650 Transcript_4835/m.14650 type:complete len:248 (+) Transcript_4835:303-1046(+)
MRAAGARGEAARSPAEEGLGPRRGARVRDELAGEKRRRTDPAPPRDRGPPRAQTSNGHPPAVLWRHARDLVENRRSGARFLQRVRNQATGRPRRRRLRLRLGLDLSRPGRDCLCDGVLLGAARQRLRQGVRLGVLARRARQGQALDARSRRGISSKNRRPPRLARRQEAKARNPARGRHRSRHRKDQTRQARPLRHHDRASPRRARPGRRHARQSRGLPLARYPPQVARLGLQSAAPAARTTLLTSS